jgi:hypothetical protein
VVVLMNVLVMEPARNITTTSRELIFTLDKNAIDYIEELRHNHPNGSVVLRFELNVVLLLHELRLGGYKPHDRNSKEPAILSSPYDPIRPDNNFNILVTPEIQGIFSYHVTHDIKEYGIGSGQWISDFQKPLGIGNFLITPITPNKLKDIPEQQLTEDEIKFRKRLVKAYQTLSEMERLLRIGEWGSVVKQSRELLELFEKDETKFIKETLVQTTSILEEKSQSFVDGIGKLYDYAHGLHHSVINKGEQRGNPMPVYTGGKEDAYMVYALSTSIINLLTKKFQEKIFHRNNKNS